MKKIILAGRGHWRLVAVSVAAGLVLGPAAINLAAASAAARAVIHL